MLKNAKHELFAQSIAAGKTLEESYQLAGYEPHRQNASRLITNDDIRARVDELLNRVADGVVLTKQWVIERLIQNVERSMQLEEIKDAKGIGTGEYRYEGSVANRALELLGKEQGMFIERREDVSTRRHIEQIDARIRQFLGTDGEAGASESVGGTGADSGGNETIPTVPGHGTA